jgi:hypothetical protein
MRNLSDDKLTKENESQLRRGNRVIARNDLVGYFYPAQITYVHNSRHVDVKFDHTEESQHKMSFRNVIKQQANSSGFFSAGDYVMACVVNEFEEKCWVPGIIQSKIIATKPCCLKCLNVKMFRILYFNGQEGDNSESELLKINKHSYGFIVSFIRSKLGISSNVAPTYDPSKHDKSLATVGTETDREEDDTEQDTDPASSGRHVNEEEIQIIKTDIISEIKQHFDSCK